MGTTLHEGWAILTFADRAALAGLLRYEKIGAVYQWAVDVPACHHHSGYTALIDPLSVNSVLPCTDTEAVQFMSVPAPRRKPPAA